MKRCLSALILLWIAFFISCAGSASLPHWVRNHPQESQYYTGIGSSNTGSEAEDREMARLAAINELAASISVTIRSELELVQRETSDGEEFRQIEQRITENLHHTLDGIRIHDSFYDQRHGYWIYVRLSRADFERQKQGLRRRVLDLADGREQDLIAGRIAGLTAAINLLYDSPYFASIPDEEGEGILADRLESTLNNYLRSLRISFADTSIISVVGRQTPVELYVLHDNLPVEGIPLRISTGNGRSFGPYYSDADGRLKADIDLGLEPGEHTLFAAVDTRALGVPVEKMRNNPETVTRNLRLQVDQVRCQLAFRQTGSSGIPGIDNMILALFSRSGFPLTITAAEADLKLDVELVIEDFPRHSESSLFISQARLFIRLQRNGNTVYTYESNAQRDGGISIAQSHERSAKKLLREVVNDSAYIEGITRFLSIE